MYRTELDQPVEDHSYGTWESAVNEHIVRALTARHASSHISASAGAEELQRDKDKRFLYLDALIERLKQYEYNPRSSFRTIRVTLTDN